MSKHSMPRARVALLICMAALLAACGHTDPDARTLQPPGGSAGATGSGGIGNGTASGNSDSPDQGNSTNTDQSSDAQNGDSDSDDSDDSTGGSPEPGIPDGTLSYTIVLSGHSVLDTPGKHDVYDVARRLQVTSKMHGTVILAGLSAAPVTATLDRKIQACNGDEACERSVGMSFAMQHQDELVEETRRAATAAGGDWLKAGACKGTASVNDTGDNHWKGWDTQLNGHISKQGTRTFDCSGQTGVDFKELELAARTDTHRYTLTLPRFQMEARYVFGDKPPTTDVVNFPPIVIKDVKFASLDAPLHGSVTLHTGDGSGNELYDPEGPLTAKVDWTFTPDAK